MASRTGSGEAGEGMQGGWVAAPFHHHHSLRCSPAFRSRSRSSRSSSGVGSKREGSGQLVEPGESEEPLEQLGRREDRCPETGASRLLDQPALGQRLDRRLRGDAADPGDLGARDRLQVGDDRERLGLGLGQRRRPRLRQQATCGLLARRVAGEGRSRRRPRAGRSRDGPRRGPRGAARSPRRPVPRSPRSPRPDRRPRPAAARGRAAPRSCGRGRSCSDLHPADLDRAERLALLPGHLALAVELEQGEQGHRLGQAVLAAELRRRSRCSRVPARASRRARRRRSSETVGRMWLMSSGGGVVSRSPRAVPSRSGS